MTATAAGVRERPIIFGADSVRAILDGRKTQTRRVIQRAEQFDKIRDCGFLCPYGTPGDQLWVREAWRAKEQFNELAPRDIAPGTAIDWLADPPGGPKNTGRYRHAHFMPRWASRITLEIEGVRVERLQEIGEYGAEAEGMRYHNGGGIGHSGYRHSIDHGVVYETARHAFAIGWDEINGKRAPWASNPWVWVLTFRRCE